MMVTVKLLHIPALKIILLEDVTNQCDKDIYTNRKMSRVHKKTICRKQQL